MKNAGVQILQRSGKRCNARAFGLLSSEEIIMSDPTFKDFMEDQAEKRRKQLAAKRRIKWVRPSACQSFWSWLYYSWNYPTSDFSLGGTDRQIGFRILGIEIAIRGKL